MKQFKRGGSALVAALALSGCTIAKPLIDRRMAEAPNAACVAVNGRQPVVEGAAAGGRCFALHEEVDGRRQPWSGGALQPGRTLLAIHQPGTSGCAGRFTHLTVTGASPGPGQLELATWDMLARAGHNRQHRWERGFAQRTLGMASIDSATMTPAGVRIRALAGSFDPANLCFKSY
jgi:hypothetical protein